MVLPDRVISVKEFEAIIDTNEILEVLSSFGLIEEDNK